MSIYWGTAASFIFFVAVGFIVSHFLNFQGQTWAFFMALMSMLGLTSSAFFMYLQNKAQRRKEQRQAAAAAAAAGAAPGSAPPPDPGQAALWIKEANSRLAQSKPGVGVENLPMMFVIGDRGTAKTSSILNSGLEPELLAGQVYQDNIVTPTRGVNIFYARDTVFVEAGGSLMASPAAWKNLVTKLRPGQLKSLIGKGGQAPRAVLLCFDLEAFTRQGAAEAITGAARYLQERLGDISQALGINVPVYVLFTRADRLPFFADWVHNLTNEEAGQAVGITLPMRAAAAQGVYAETETQRLTAAFNALFHSFSDHRLMILPRESDLTKVPGAYEFPREFRKLRNMLVQFLVDIGRPSQLRASPFLRGFYFSGVRPVEVRDVAPAAPIAPAPQAQEASGATRMFRAGFQAEQRAAQAYAPQFGATRKIPQWLFLGHLFLDVLLADNAARAASGSSIKTSLTKRILLAAAAFVFLFYSVMLVVSYFGNKSLEDTAIVAARNIGNADVLGGNLPTQDALVRLDTLRMSLQQISDYHANGAPFHLRWGLYSGDAMLANLRRVYYNKFRQLLFGSTQGQMLAFLQTRPATPGPQDDYGFAYDTLKTYLLTTGEWKRASEPSLQTFLAARLLTRWSAGHETEIGSDRMSLAKAQFDFYARDLKNGNPFSPNGDAGAIDRSRRYLAGFTGVQRVYQFLLSEAAKRTPPTTFNQKFPGTGEVVTSGVEVAFAFTKDGWAFMQDQIRKQNFGGEQWVLGSYMGQGLDQATMEKGILDLYTKDYIDQWRKVLRGSRVNPYANFADAGRKLALLTSPNAPLLALFWWTSQNTAINLAGIADKFQPVQAVSPPGPAQQYILPPNQNYNNSLIALQSSVQRASTQPNPSQDQGWPPVKDAAVTAARQLASAFRPDPEGHVDQMSLDLLLQPTDLDRLGAVDLTSAGRQFCLAFNPLTTKFPFNSTAVPEVNLNELADILRPGTGKFYQFAMQLNGRLQCQNGQCTASGGNPPLSPLFVAYMSQMMQFSRALYGDSGLDPNYKYSLRPQTSDQVESFDVTVNGEKAPLKGGAQHAYVWPGPGNRNFNLTLHLAGGSPLEGTPWDGLWAVFRFFADADSSNNTPAGSSFTWTVRSGRAGLPQNVNGRPLRYEFVVDTGGAPAVFSKDFLSKLRCILPNGQPAR